MWEYQCQMGRVVDGDTVDLIVDLGFRTRHRVRARLRGVDTAEIYGVAKDSDEYADGMEHTRYTRDWFTTGFVDYDAGSWPFIVASEPPTGKYGRWIATVKRKSDSAVLNDDLIVDYPSVESR